jgi:hypothetical protein
MTLISEMVMVELMDMFIGNLGYSPYVKEELVATMASTSPWPTKEQ